MPLEIPIRFEDGSSLTHQFTTHREKRYELIVAFHKQASIEPAGRPPDEFSVEFRIIADGVVVAEGNNDSNDRHPAFLSRDCTARPLAVFPGQPGKLFQLWFRVVRAAPSLSSTKPVVMVTEKTYPPGK